VERRARIEPLPRLVEHTDCAQHASTFSSKRKVTVLGALPSEALAAGSLQDRVRERRYRVEPDEEARDDQDGSEASPYHAASSRSALVDGAGELHPCDHVAEHRPDRDCSEHQPDVDRVCQQ
jgi:hypothetical protein